MKIIVGLGNPGAKYGKTRHNVGFMVIDRFARKYDMVCSQKRFQALFCKGCIGKEETILLKPLTYMNLSGAAVKEAAGMYKCELNDILVVCDDLDLPLGKIRIRRNGGCGGHRGLESVKEHLGSSGFSRLRIGIGRPVFGDPADYVLSEFSKEEEVVIMDALEGVCDALSTWVLDGMEACMNKFN
jgi:PTH1 family peptidyl-tRNA hydrolase